MVPGASAPSLSPNPGSGLVYLLYVVFSANDPTSPEQA